ncbi:hypothetical protein D3C77_540820 [compost metagenome]
MLGSGNEIQWIVPDGDGAHRQTGLRGQGDDRQFGAAMQHFLVGDLRVEKADIQADQGIAAGEVAQHGRQAMQADMVAGGQGQSTADFAAQVVQGAPGVVQHIDDLVGARQQRTPGFGQAHFAPEPIEQPHIKLLFQGSDALADCRLGQVQALGCRGKAARFGDGKKGMQGGEVHEEVPGSRILGIPFWNPSDEKYEFELSATSS